MQFIGQKLQALRKARNKTMTALFEDTGIQQGALSQIENGLKNPRPGTVKKLANALGVEPKYFYLEETALTPDILPHITEELKLFLMNEKNLPYIVLSKEAEAHGIPPENLKAMLDALIKIKGSKNKNN